MSHSPSKSTRVKVLYDPADHTYWSRGRRLPSVTAILRWAGQIPEHAFRGPVVQQALARGRRVHRATAHLDHQRAEVAKISVLPGEEGYVDAWRRFCAFAKPVWTHIEYPSAYSDGGDPGETPGGEEYAGTVDRVGYLTGTSALPGLIIPDLKTGQKQPWHRLQLAAYELMLARELPAGVPRTRVGIYLRNDGTFSVEVYDQPSDRDRFRTHLRDWREANAEEEWRRARGRGDDVDLGDE